MNPLESRIDELLTQYLGAKWKTFTGCLLFVVAFLLRCVVTSPDAVELCDIVMVAGLGLAGIGGYHKITQTRRIAEKALAQSHETRLPREG